MLPEFIADQAAMSDPSAPHDMMTECYVPMPLSYSEYTQSLRFKVPASRACVLLQALISCRMSQIAGSCCILEMCEVFD